MKKLFSKISKEKLLSMSEIDAVAKPKDPPSPIPPIVPA